METTGFMVTDYEVAFINALKKYFPNMPLLRCWKHLWGSIERWVRDKGGKISDIGFYIDSVREILLQPSAETFAIMLKNKKIGYNNISNLEIMAWDAAFTEYFEKNIETEIKSLALYVVKPMCKGLFNAYTGITTNQCEGLNNLLKNIGKL
jgi:hypothetical protein